MIETSSDDEETTTSGTNKSKLEISNEEGEQPQQKMQEVTAAAGSRDSKEAVGFLGGIFQVLVVMTFSHWLCRRNSANKARQIGLPETDFKKYNYRWDF
mgnify:CR=1 FL=1